RDVDAHTAGVLAVLAIIILCTVPSSLIGLFLLIRRLLRRLWSLTLRRCDAKSGPLGETYEHGPLRSTPPSPPPRRPPASPSGAPSGRAPCYHGDGRSGANGPAGEWDDLWRR